jgi:hypothetical protein
MKIFVLPILPFLLMVGSLWSEERIPFYEDYLESGKLKDYLEVAHKFLEDNPDSDEAPRLALDLIMMGKATEDVKSVIRGTDLLLFDYLGTLPSLHFISSFDKGSPRLSELLKVKIEDNVFSDQNFSNQFADTLTLLGRIHGPELLSDPRLLLWSFLLVSNTQNEPLMDNLEKLSLALEEKNFNYRALFSLIKSSETPISKIMNLLKLKSVETDFLIKFYTSQLSEEEKSTPEFLEAMIDFTLYGVPPKPDLALGYLSNLPDEISTLPKYQFSTAFAHLIKGNEVSSQSILESLAQTSSDPDPWVQVAQSIKDGKDFADSRKALFLELLEKLYERLFRETEAFLIEGSWDNTDSSNSLNFVIGVNKSTQSVQIHLIKNEQPHLSYLVQPDHCQIFTDSGRNIKFSSGGAYLLPKIQITRNPDLGSFNYSFNLNFGKSFEDFSDQVSQNLEISYLSTEKGREVLLNHLFERKGIWLSPPASSDLGTVITINQIDPQVISKTYRIEISLSGELISLILGKLKITKFSQGRVDLLSNLPKWPDSSNITEGGEFELPILMECIGNLLSPPPSQDN